MCQKEGSLLKSSQKLTKNIQFFILFLISYNFKTVKDKSDYTSELEIMHSKYLNMIVLVLYLYKFLG